MNVRRMQIAMTKCASKEEQKDSHRDSHRDFDKEYCKYADCKGII